MRARLAAAAAAVRPQRAAWHVTRGRRAAPGWRQCQGLLGPALRCRGRAWLNPQVPSLVSLLNSCAPVRHTDLSGAPVTACAPRGAVNSTARPKRAGQPRPTRRLRRHAQLEVHVAFPARRRGRAVRCLQVNGHMVATALHSYVAPASTRRRRRSAPGAPRAGADAAWSCDAGLGRRCTHAPGAGRARGAWRELRRVAPRIQRQPPGAAAHEEHF